MRRKPKYGGNKNVTETLFATKSEAQIYAPESGDKFESVMPSHTECPPHEMRMLAPSC